MGNEADKKGKSEITILDQYKLAAEMIDRSRDRRQKENRFFYLLLTGLIALAVLVLKQVDLSVEIVKQYVVFFTIAWVCICLVWQSEMILYKRSNRSMFEALHQIEKKEDSIFYLFGINKIYIEVNEEGSLYYIPSKVLKTLRRITPFLYLLLGLIVGIYTFKILSNAEQICFVSRIYSL